MLTTMVSAAVEAKESVTLPSKVAETEKVAKVESPLKLVYFVEGETALISVAPESLVQANVNGGLPPKTVMVTAGVYTAGRGGTLFHDR